MTTTHDIQFDPSKPYKTMQTLQPAMGIEDQAEADEYFEKLVTYHMKRHGLSREEAESNTRQNLGYWAGYGDDALRIKVERLFRCAHPFFGKAADGVPTTEEAFEMGMRAGAEG